MKTVEQLVTEFQSGNTGVFSEIYNALLTKKKQLVSIGRRKLPLSVPTSDIEATYDDCFMAAIDNFDPTAGAKFSTYLSTIMERAVINLYDKATRQCRVNTLGSDICLDYTTSEGECVAEVVEDYAAQREVLQAEGSEIMNALDAYGSLKDSNQINAVLILQDSMYFDTADEKYDRMRAVTGLKAGNDALRKRCQRAKADFRKFAEGYQFAF